MMKYATSAIARMTTTLSAITSGTYDGLRAGTGALGAALGMPNGGADPTAGTAGGVAEFRIRVNSLGTCADWPAGAANTGGGSVGTGIIGAAGGAGG